MKDIKQLANEHWNWVSKLLKLLTNANINMEVVEYLYKTALIHGYKHGLEDKEE